MYYDLCLVCNDIVKSKDRRYDTNGEPVCPHCNSAGTLAKDMVQISGNNRNIILQRDAQGYSFVYKKQRYYLDHFVNIGENINVFPKWLQSFNYMHYIFTPRGKPRSGILARIGVGSTVKVYSFTIY